MGRSSRFDKRLLNGLSSPLNSRPLYRLGLGDAHQLMLTAQVRLELHPNMSRNAFPAAVLVSMGCLVALRGGSLGLVRTMSWRSPMDRARRVTPIRRGPWMGSWPYTPCATP